MSLTKAINNHLQRLFQNTRSDPEMTVDSSSEEQNSSQTNHRGVKRPTRSFPEFFVHLKSLGFDPKVCIDVGAATGTLSIYEAFPKSTHYAFEPLPDFQEALNKNLSAYAHVVKSCALSDEVGVRTLLKHADLFGSSLMHLREESDERLVEVETSTLDAEMAEVDLSGHVLLKTDCQGSDLMVLKGGLKTLESCDAVIVEASMFRFWGAHQPDFYEIVEFMKAKGFVLYDLLDGLYRPLDAALGQVDLAFVKDLGEFRRRHYW